MKVLLLDTNLSSLPIYKYLKNQGHEVFVIGVNKSDTLAQSSNNYIELDYSNIELVNNYMNINKFDFAIPGCNDISYKIASILNENRGDKLNVSPSHINEIINNKNKFKKFALENGLKVPMVYSKNEISKINNKKIIVKPTDAYSGKGVSVISDFSNYQFIEAVKYAELNSFSNDCIIEEFVSGDLYSHSAFIKDGEYFEDFIVQEYCTKNPFSVDTSWVVDKIKFPLYKEIRDEVKKIYSKLNLCDGLIHTQFIVQGDSFWILEVTRRCPGDLYSKLIEYSADFDYSKHYVDFILKSTPLPHKNFNKNRILRKTITFNEEALWYSIQNNNKNLSIIEFFPLATSGEKMEKAPKGRVGIVFFSSELDFNINEL
jgi:predicted ATP-grasp superfamily ATP-dependent carboligase